MTLRVAILGAGIGAQHLDGYLALPGIYSVTCVCDQDFTKAQALANTVADCDAVCDVNQVIGRSDIDIIDVCLPPHLHAPISIKSLQAGHHVICEKPLAESVVAAKEMIAAAHSANRLLTPIFQYRYGHAFTQLRALIDAGLAGTPHVASLETHWNRGDDYYAVPWRGTWARERGGAVLGHAIHIHDLIAQFFGEITTVSATLDTRINPIETEDCAALSLRTASGALVTSSITLGGAGDHSRMRLVFEHLTAESATTAYAPGQGNWSFTARDAGNQASVDEIVSWVPSSDHGYAGQFRELAIELDGKPHANVSADDGKNALELVAGIYKSNRTQRHVMLPLDEADPYTQDWRPS